MKVIYETTPPSLYMLPENDRDRKVIRRLIDNDQTSGCGIDPRTGQPIHCTIEL